MQVKDNAGFFLIFIYFSLFGCSGSSLRHVGSSSLTKDQTQVPCIGSLVSYPLDHQGNPWGFFLAALGLHCGEWAFSSYSTGSVLLWHKGFSCETQALEYVSSASPWHVESLLPDQGSNLHPQNWQVDS